ncbi:component of actin cortical patches LAS17 [Fusarium napiforme]|uniref:Component of actin cortical patches LAS17 n=1 Tax=Fusarium napiforme TaxID=42672 RepID=A0A8H5ML46_9HYPO|nr:component of actin cortical patches LAS17 [Fusarium napiforme]
MAERWDRDRFERMRGEQNRDRFDDDRSYTRSTRGRDHSDERYDRRPGRGYYEEEDIRDRRYYGDDRYQPQRERERDMPPPWARRTDVLERERERDFPRRESPPRRPGFLRRQSSLDTFDRRPRIFQDREEYPPPARREDIRPRDHRDPRDDYRAPPYTPIPLPKSRGLPPPRRYGDEYYDDIKIAEPDYYGDDDYRSMPERVREREYTRSRNRRGRSRESRSTRTRSVRSSSYSSSSSRSSSSSGGTTVKSEYPKKGKTRIPAKLVSKRALIDLGYPFFEEGTTIIVQKALGQDNIDELLKVSEDYKKVEAEIAASREPKAPTAALPAPPPKEKLREPTPEPPPAKTPPPPAPPVQAPPAQAPPAAMPVATPAPPPPVQMMPPPQQTPMPPPPVQMMPPPMAQPGPPPGFYQPGPPPPPQPGPFEYAEETVIRDVSPSRFTTTTTSSSWDSYHHHHHPAEELVVRSRSRSRSGREIRKEIKALERELAHRPRGRSTSGEIVRAERLPDGQLVIREERLEKVVEHRKPPRIEKDKKGPPPKLMRAMFATLT